MAAILENMAAIFISYHFKMAIIVFGHPYTLIQLWYKGKLVPPIYPKILILPGWPMDYKSSQHNSIRLFRAFPVSRCLTNINSPNKHPNKRPNKELFIISINRA